ncbi:unnamed protein product [Linum trigynum]|uniref:Uncharacterized protein n=1 Tax=Linum trigynum TaxID=586398 RepID=A0AAV2GLX1_9ROSI
MKSKGSQGKRAQAPIPSNNVLSVSEAECDDVGMDSLSGEEMEVEMDASTSKVVASDHTGSASTHINSPMPKGRRLTSKVWVQFRRKQSNVEGWPDPSFAFKASRLFFLFFPHLHSFCAGMV